ncbi:MAG: hypothetical protein E6I85_02100 [Chloroflexi bacterium]|nr:MAG: hypothetical protein E6I85_02100 [Chloroflexota bacterium]
MAIPIEDSRNQCCVQCGDIGHRCVWPRGPRWLAGEGGGGWWNSDHLIAGESPDVVLRADDGLVALAAPWLVEAGIHPKVIQELIGHKTIATTLDTYSHALPVPHGQAIRVFRG